ncbi:aspartyl-phosphate phosphatase Spo0E family protein [Aquibacillus salsiterrae]|uniref:Aspartyl-phosphate phosphatase Spo0E family protein n=1 Tax=Aquibacillus salsiterrae TaxID=2950439 RepID=A0A9X3WDD7_9BACI|nr:aspartyl-phosphate phosphatase Spo0E family protein [Aquibacillus salsiterrae]MDC3416025.1 aspartyl-phosphate phosphatase Spo0E family protein [Aquibacillus salsiterrae]
MVKVKVKNQLEEQMEELRNKMYETYRTNQSSDEVLKISQQLDQLINQAHRIAYPKNTHRKRALSS